MATSRFRTPRGPDRRDDLTLVEISGAGISSEPRVESQANTTITAMTSYAGSLYACTSTGLQLRTQSEDFRRSHDIWHCNFGVGLATVDFMLFVATSENRLWWLDLTLLASP